jgi:hypothetical protein
MLSSSFCVLVMFCWLCSVCSVVRCKFDHLVNRSNSSTGQTAAKACSGHCEAFFLRVLGDPQQPGSAQWPAVSEMKPNRSSSTLQMSVPAKLFGSLLVCVCSVGTSAGYVVCLLCRTMLRSMFDHWSNSSKGLQWAQEHCEAFFLRVLGDPRQPGSAPWPAVSEMKPKQELKYFASECVSVLAR